MSGDALRGAKLTERSPGELDEDPRFRFSYPIDQPRLEDSIRRAGVIRPVMVAKMDNGERLVSGFRRVKAAKSAGIETVPVVMIEEVEPYDLLLAHVEENASSRILNLVELSHIILSAVEAFERPGEEVIGTLFPILGLSRSRRIFNTLIDVARFGPDAKRLIAAAGMTAGAASRLARFDPGERETVCRWLDGRRFGLNRSNQLIDMILDLKNVEGVAAERIIEQADAAVPETHDAPQRANRLFEIIRKRRQPELSRMETAFDAAVKELRLPPAMAIRPPKNFEGARIEFIIKASGADEAKAAARAIAEADESTIARLFAWI